MARPGVVQCTFCGSYAAPQCLDINSSHLLFCPASHHLLQSFCITPTLIQTPQSFQVTCSSIPPITVLPYGRLGNPLPVHFLAVPSTFISFLVHPGVHSLSLQLLPGKYYQTFATFISFYPACKMSALNEPNYLLPPTICTREAVFPEKITKQERWVSSKS